MPKKEIDGLFTDEDNILEVQKKLPKIFRIAEIECSRNGKIGMEVGSVRERAVIALLIHKFGEDNVNADIPITEPETDVILNNEEISIKTITGNGGIKAIWTVDAEKSKLFVKEYQPKCDIILVKINWGAAGGFYLIPLEVQKEVFKQLGNAKYFKLPKPGTNPRGVEFSKEAIKLMLEHDDTLMIPIDWRVQDLDYNVYDRWVDYWEEDSD